MGYEKVAREYLKNRVMTASPTEIIVMLYDAAISNLEAAQTCIQQRNRAGSGMHISKAQRIVAELISSLNRQDGGEVVQQLDALYSFVIDRLVTGNLRQDQAALGEAARVMKTLREGWATIVSDQSGGRMNAGV